LPLKGVFFFSAKKNQKAIWDFVSHEAWEFVYFLHCPKSNKNASRSKNSPERTFICIAFCSAFSLIVFQILFFEIVITYRDLFPLKTGHRGARTVLSDSPVPIRNDFQKTSIAAAGR